MRRVRYQVACSLDGYIAGPNGEHDWIVMDPDIDFHGLFAEFDTIIMGRRTFEAAGGGVSPGMTSIVVSRTLREENHPGITIIGDGLKETIDDLRTQTGKDIWLFGGGQLFRSLLELDCVDSVEPAIMPVVLGGGIPLLPAPAVQRKLSFRTERVYGKSGTVVLCYDVIRE
jgi:dihydrofolate reductase